MIPSETAHDCLRRAFAPTQGGIVGLTDQFLAACAGSDVEIRRVGDRLGCNWTINGETQAVSVPLPSAAFRTILARIAALCNDHRPNAVTPYGGTALLVVKGTPPRIVRVSFVNTPNEQRLEVKGVDQTAAEILERLRHESHTSESSGDNPSEAGASPIRQH